MMVHLAQPPDLQALILRAQNDEDLGRTELALLRLEDAHAHFPEHGSVLYAEGLIRQNRLGQGQASYRLFESAFEAAMRGRGAPTTKWFAACNAAVLAPNETAYRRWAQAANRSRPILKWTEFIDVSKVLAGAPSFDDLQLRGAAQAFEQGNFGLSAAINELVLARIQCSDRVRVDLLKSRALALRRLDQAEQQRRSFAGEAMPAVDRLALRDAAATMESVLQINPYDAEGWNFICAWKNLLGVFEEACAAADRAIELRPVHYSKPHTNKAAALANLSRRAEACEEARAGLAMAQADPGLDDENNTDIQICQALIAENCGPEPPPPADDAIAAFIDKILHGAKMAATEYAAKAKASIPQLVEALRNRWISSGSAVDRSAIVGDLLMFFPPDTAWFVLDVYASVAFGVAEQSMGVCAAIIAEGSAAQRRDAAKLLALLVIAGKDYPQIRDKYRVGVMIPSRRGVGPLKKLEDMVKLELDRFSPNLTAWIADQSPLTPEEMQAAS